MFNKKITLLLFVLGYFLTSTLQVKAQDTASSDSLNIFEYLYNMPGKPKLVMNADFKSLIKNKMEEEKVKGTMTIIVEGADPIELNMSVRARGNMRKRQCYYPPLKADFNKGQLRDLGLTDFDKLKFVLQCRDHNTGYQYLIKERLIYDLYDVIDDNGVRTKLVQVDLYKNGELDAELEGFIIEDEEQFGKRIGGKIIESGNVRSASIDRGHYLKMAFFQYMIGNTDWAIPNKHNVEIVGLPQFNRVVAIPYDFDYAGFVGTNYAVPHESLPIEKVSEFHFMGFYVTEAEALASAKYFLEIKDEFYKVIEECSYCDDKVKNDSADFISKFFKLLESDKRVKRAFVTAQ